MKSDSDKAMMSRRALLIGGIGTVAGGIAPNALSKGGSTEVADPQIGLEAIGIPADGYVPSLLETELAYASLSTIRLQTYSTALQSGVNVNAVTTLEGGEVIPRYDWSCRSYNQVVEAEVALLAEMPQSVPGLDHMPDLGEGGRTFLAKLLAVLGLSDVWNAFLGALDELGENLLERIAWAIRNKYWSLLRNLLQQLLDLILSQGFRNLLGRRIGSTVAARIIGKIAAKLLPIVGWAILVGELVWAVAEQYLSLVRSEPAPAAV